MPDVPLRAPHRALTLLAARQVRPIVEAVRTRGDAAVAEFTARFDGVTLPAHVVRVAVRPPSPRAPPTPRASC